jgi:hypothetical protein
MTPAIGNDPFRPEMTAQAVEVTGWLLSHASKWLKTTAFCFFCIPHSAQQLETTAWLVSHLRQEVENDRLTNFLSVPLKTTKDWYFVLTLESLHCKFQRNSVGGSGYDVHSAEVLN